MLIKEVKYILNKLNDNGYKAYVVGGAVRSYLTDNPIYDYDITTDAKPDEVIKIFSKTIPTGIKYGTITVVENDKYFEVTTFRSDGDYLDNRRPENVEFSDSLQEDLKRRDFTINALCMDANENIVDYTNGMYDIEHKIIRCIGNPDERFREDALRMIRAVRFMCQLGFAIDENTDKSICRNSYLLSNVSVERIQQEFNKILLSDKPSDGIRKLMNTDLIRYIVPEIIRTKGFEQKNPYHNKDVFDHTMVVLDSISPKLHLRLAALMHDIAKPECFFLDEKGIGHFNGHHIKSAERAEEILKRLRYSNDIIDKVCTIIRYHYVKDIETKDRGIKKFINTVGVERLDDMYEIYIADTKGKAIPDDFDNVNILKHKVDEILARKEPFSIKDLSVNGQDLKNLGIPEGKIFGELLNKCLDYVLDNPDANNKEELIKYIKSII